MTDQVAKVINIGKNKMATGLDGCPYKLRKALKSQHEYLLTQLNAHSFDIVKTLTEIITNIQLHNLDPNTNFATTWMAQSERSNRHHQLLPNYYPKHRLQHPHKSPSPLAKKLHPYPYPP